MASRRKQALTVKTPIDAHEGWGNFQAARQWSVGERGLVGKRIRQNVSIFQHFCNKFWLQWVCVFRRPRGRINGVEAEDRQIEVADIIECQVER
jgi:hypothetical protein